MCVVIFLVFGDLKRSTEITPKDAGGKKNSSFSLEKEHVWELLCVVTVN